MNTKVDFYFNEAEQWQEELKYLRKILLDCGLNEELKWAVPCYTFHKKNIVLMCAFKGYCALLFHKGVLLSDEEGILIQQTENVQSARQIRFTSVREIAKLQLVLKAYVFEAIEVERAGLKVEIKKTSVQDVPEELQHVFKENTTLKTAFYELTPGRQRAYFLYFAQPKQAKTRQARIDKYMPRILKGKGLNDCICGLSKRMPNCDGSHKILGDGNQA